MRFDATTGLYRGTVARVYDPATGRWTSPNPERYNGGATNLYVFAGNRPTTASDPSGLWSLRAAWNAVATTVSDAATGVAQAVQQAFRTVVTAAGEFKARVYDVWQAGVNQVTWLTTEAGKQLVILGNQAVEASQAVAQVFVAKLDQFGKSFDELWAKVLQFGAAAKDVLWSLVQDPAGTLSKLAASVGQGIKDFFYGLSSTLPNVLLSWVTGNAGLANMPPLPTDWTNIQKVGAWLLDFFQLNWDGIQGVLVQKLGASNVALVSQAYTAIQTWASQGTDEVFKWLQAEAVQLTPQALMQKAIDSAMGYVTTRVVPWIAGQVAAKFVPGGAILSSVYNTLTWLSDQVEKFQGLAELGTKIAARIGAVVHDAPGAATQLAADVKGFMDGLVPVVMTFVVSQLGLGKLPQYIGEMINRVRDYPLGLIAQAIDKVANNAKGLLGLNGPNASQYQGLLARPATFRLLRENHRLWAVNQNARAALMRASTPTQ